MHNYHYTDISGIFVKIIRPDESELILKRNTPNRPAARYNRVGQNALYLSVDEHSAKVAMQKYKDDIEGSLVLAEYEVSHCQLVDLRHKNSEELRLFSSQDWRAELAAELEPSSWQASDNLRSKNEIGLIDPSRKNPDIWHLTLFQWNEAGAPTVKLVGAPKPISID